MVKLDWKGISEEENLYIEYLIRFSALDIVWTDKDSILIEQVVFVSIKYLTKLKSDTESILDHH